MASQNRKNVENWIKAKRHTVLLPSNTEVDIILPNLAAMLKAGRIPSELVSVAIAVATGDVEVTEQMLKDQDDFSNLLASMTVVEPEITVEQAAELPVEDRDMIVQFATRTRDIDASGTHMAGIELQSSFRPARR